MTLGEVIKEYRREHGLSMEKFAELSRLSKGYISMLEKNKNPRNGKPIIPSILTYRNVAAGMGVAVEELLKKVSGEYVVINATIPICGMPLTDKPQEFSDKENETLAEAIKASLELQDMSDSENPNS